MNELVTTETTELTVIQPKDVIAQATIAAKALKDVLDRKPRKIIISGREYLEFPDWQTVGYFYHTSVCTHDAVYVEINGISGAKASASLIDDRTGLKIGSAEAYCLRDEPKWDVRAKYRWVDKKRIQDGFEPVPWFQLASMAQTRAASKALSNKFRWVVVLAGYSGTPAEEVDSSDIEVEEPKAKPKPQLDRPDRTALDNAQPLVFEGEAQVDPDAGIKARINSKFECLGVKERALKASFLNKWKIAKATDYFAIEEALDKEITAKDNTP